MQHSWLPWVFVRVLQDATVLYTYVATSILELDEVVRNGSRTIHSCSWIKWHACPFTLLSKDVPQRNRRQYADPTLRLSAGSSACESH